MAETGVNKATAALAANTNNTVTLSGGSGLVEVKVHRSSGDVVYVRGDGTAAVVAADECEAIDPGESLVIACNLVMTGTTYSAVVNAISASAGTITAALR